MEIRIVTPRDNFYLDSALQLAFSAYREDAEANQTDSRQVQACVIGTIACACSFLEVAINSVFEGDYRSYRKTKYSDALDSVWSEGFDRQPTLAKYQIALALARVNTFSRGIEPYQSADALIALRNTISHPKKITSSDQEQEKIERILKGKYEFGKLPSELHEFFPSACLVPACAAWAVFSAVTFFKEFNHRLPASARSFTPFLDAYIATSKRLLAKGYEMPTKKLFGLHNEDQSKG